MQYERLYVFQHEVLHTIHTFSSLFVASNDSKSKINSEVYNIYTRKTLIFTNLYQTYRYIEKESTLLAQRCLIISHQASNVWLIVSNNLNPR